MIKSMRDKIREATVGAKKHFESKKVTFSGFEIEVRQLSLFERRKYIESCVNKETNTADMLKLQVNAIIASCFVPGTDEPVFEDADYDSIANSVTGGYADVLWQAIQEMQDITVDDAKKN